ncbi:unnamed protein product [Lactuca saligna]|uniref:Lon N-terminal domain-containing protein n=1 Tax=Lactuca saligna TaxID=75948 RepID=A0AA35V2Q3_LACSI|nr:unnamed protein product [Lactuca saligna]
MLSDSRSVLPGVCNNRRSHFRLTSSPVSIGSPPHDHPPRHKIIQLGIFLLDLFRDADLFHHFSSLLESAIFPAIVMNEKDIMEWEEDSDEYIRKNLPSELLKWEMKCRRKRMELKRCKKDIAGRLTPLHGFGGYFRAHQTNCEPVKYSDGQQHVNEEEVVGEAFEDSVLQKLQKHMGDFNYPRLAYFVAAISGSNKVQCQQVLEELDVYKQLRLSIELLKKEMEIQRILIDSTMLGVYDRFNKGLSDSIKLMEERNMKPLDLNLATLSARCSKDLELNLAKSLLSEMGQCTTAYPYNQLFRALVLKNYERQGATLLSWNLMYIVD